MVEGVGAYLEGETQKAFEIWYRNSETNNRMNKKYFKIRIQGRQDINEKSEKASEDQFVCSVAEDEKIETDKYKTCIGDS